MLLEINKKEDVLKLQEAVANKLKRGEIIDKNYILLYNKLKEFDIPKNEVITKNIEFLQKHFDSLNKEEKYLVNNLLFALDILNGDAKEGLKRAIFRMIQFNVHEIENNPEILFFIQFVQNLDDYEYLMEILKEVYKNYFSFPYEIRRYIIANTLVIFWNNKYLHINKLWLDFFENLVNLINETIQKEEIEDLMPLHFLAYHIYGNNVQTIDEWRVFNEKVDKQASKFYKQWAKKNNILSNNKGKKKIGFLIDRIVLNSPFMVFYSLLKSLMENEEFKKEYEVFVYSMEYIYKQPDDEAMIEKLSKLGVKVYTPSKFKSQGYHFSHLKKALDLREKIIKDEIYYLINQTGGYDISNFLFSTRSAPVQIYWSHGNCAFDIEGIDKRISHFEQQCDEFEWEIFNVRIANEFLIGNEQQKKQGEAIKKSLLEEFGKDTVILGTIGRLVKLDSDEYLSVIAEVMKKNPNTIYLACGDGGKNAVEKRLKEHKIDRDRFIFAGMVNPHVFGWVIDVWPDTFPLRQGQSLVEAQAKGGAIIHYGPNHSSEDIEMIRNAYKKSEKALGYKLPFYPIAKNQEEYVKYLNELIKNKETRNKISKAFQYDLLEQIKNPDISSFLKAIDVS